MAAPTVTHLDFSTIGPRLGETFPEITLPDQNGGLVDLHTARGRGKALVVFYRSCRW